jgi:hypothetical protein
MAVIQVMTNSGLNQAPWTEWFMAYQGGFGATRVGIIVIPRGPLGFRPGLKWPRFSGQTWARN